MNKWILILSVGIILPFKCFADDNLPTSGSCAAAGEGNTCHWEYNADTHTLAITGSGKMAAYAINGKAPKAGGVNTAPWASYGADIYNITVEDGITNIGAGAFAYTAAQNVSLPQSITSVDGGAFYWTKGLQQVDLPENLKTIGADAFKYSNLIQIDIPATVTYIGSTAFAIMTLQEMTLPADLVTNRNNLFWDKGAEHPQNGFKVYCKGDVQKCQNIVHCKASDGQPCPFSSIVQVYRNNRRIYTIDEANQDAGKINRFSIRYR